MAPQGSAYNVDWLFSEDYSFHMVNNREWFTTFTSFESYAILPDFNRKVSGVGRVELEVRTHTGQKKSHLTRTLILHDVLYCPTARCNILGAPMLKDYHVRWGPDWAGLQEPQTGLPAALFDMTERPKLWLANQAKGSSVLSRGITFYLYASWPEGEMVRWQTYWRNLLLNEWNTLQRSSGSNASPLSTSQSTSAEKSHSPPYTASEKRWLKKNFGNEFKFLLMYELSIYKEEDRKEGRAIARAFIDEDLREEMQEKKQDEIERNRRIAASRDAAQEVFVGRVMVSGY